MLDDSILNHPLLNYESEKTLEFDKIAEEMQKAGITYPSKITFDKPETTVRISYSNGFYYVEDTRGMFNTLDEAYSYVQSLENCGSIFDQSILDLPGVESGLFGDDGITVKLPNGCVRLLFGPTDNTNLYASEYRQYLMLAKNWFKNQDNWLAAYHFIGSHPIFWHRTRPDKYPNEWVTDGGHTGMWVYPTQNDKGEQVVMLEHGQSVEPTHQHHYHDPRLDVWGTSFEDAYIQMAKLIHKYFTVDGDERKNVDYTPQPWEVELAERIKNIPDTINTVEESND